MKNRVYEIVEIAAPSDKASRVFDIVILGLIALNIVALALETVQPIYEMAPDLFRYFERVSVVIFSIEYILRIWSCTASPNFSSAIGGRIRFALTPLALTDLLAILPFYLTVLPVDLRFLRAMRLFRLFRLAKLGRYSSALQVLGRVLVKKKEELLISVFFFFLLVLLTSSLMYFAEKEAQPDVFSSIPTAMLWGIGTLAKGSFSAGVPVTLWGKGLAAVTAILGIGMFALPTGILGAGFVEEMRERVASKHCPHCGELL